MEKPIAVFLAACVGALVPILFGVIEPPGTTGRSRPGRVAVTVAYVLLAGYLASRVFCLTSEYYAFLLGVALDSLIRLLPRTASAFVEHMLKPSK